MVDLAGIIAAAEGLLAPEVEAAIAAILANPLAKGLIGSLLGFAAGDLINYFVKHPDQAAHAPHFALVDVRANKILVAVSRRRAYRFLLAPRKRSPATKRVVEVIRERRD